MNPTRVFAFSALALLAGCSSPPGESVSSTSGALSGSSFRQITGSGTSTILDVGSAPYNDNTAVFWLAGRAQTYEWDSYDYGNPWEPGIPADGITGTAIDIDDSWGIWIINGGVVSGTFALNGARVFQALPNPAGTTAADVGVSANGVIAYMTAAGTDQIYVWQGPGQTPAWQPMLNQLGTRIDASNDGSAWVVNAGGEIWHVSGWYTAPTATRIAPEHTASDITVGADGSVFYVGWNPTGTDQLIGTYVNGALQTLPGAYGTRISAASASSVTVGNSEGQLWTTAVYTPNE